MTDLTSIARSLITCPTCGRRLVVRRSWVTDARRSGTPGLLIWIPGWLWDGKTIVAADSGNSGKEVNE